MHEVDILSSSFAVTSTLEMVSRYLKLFSISLNNLKKIKPYVTIMCHNSKMLFRFISKYVYPIKNPTSTHILMLQIVIMD